MMAILPIRPSRFSHLGLYSHTCLRYKKRLRKRGPFHYLGITGIRLCPKTSFKSSSKNTYLMSHSLSFWILLTK